MDKNTLQLKTPDLTWIGHSLYVEREPSLMPVLQELRDAGYSVKNIREDDDWKRHYRTVEEFEKNVSSLWFAHLDNINFAQCLSCKEYISTVGTRYHGKTCEKCGAIIYLEIVDGSGMELSFPGKGDTGFLGPRLRVRAQFWDADAGWLYLYDDIEEQNPSKEWRRFSPEEARAYLNANTDQWSYAQRDGKRVIRVAYHHTTWSGPRYPEDAEIHEVWNHYHNSRAVRLFQGKEYSEFGDLPVPESITVYEAWRWAPLAPSPDLYRKVLTAAGQVPDQGWYHQDGRVGIYPEAFAQMRIFVDRFTTLDVSKWDRTHFRHDGPGAIADIGRFCSPGTVVENRPNIGNTLTAFGKAMSGEFLTEQEIREAKRGLDEQW